MKLMASGVANSAAMVRSPSFSLSSSSTRMIILPFLISETASSTEQRAISFSSLLYRDGRSLVWALDAAGDAENRGEAGASREAGGSSAGRRGRRGRAMLMLGHVRSLAFGQHQGARHGKSVTPLSAGAERRAGRCTLPAFSSVLFHPDCHCRHRHFTGSAPSDAGPGSRAVAPWRAPPVGTCTPP